MTFYVFRNWRAYACKIGSDFLFIIYTLMTFLKKIAAMFQVLDISPLFSPIIRVKYSCLRNFIILFSLFLYGNVCIHFIFVGGDIVRFMIQFLLVYDWRYNTFRYPWFSGIKFLSPVCYGSSYTVCLLQIDINVSIKLSYPMLGSLDISIPDQLVEYSSHKRLLFTF